MKRYLICCGFVLAGCAQIGGPLPSPVPSVADDTCNAAQHARLIGGPATALETKLLLQPVRVIRPNTAVTLDFIPQRINFMLDQDETIIRISCG